MLLEPVVASARAGVNLPGVIKRQNARLAACLLTVVVAACGSDDPDSKPDASSEVTEPDGGSDQRDPEDGGQDHPDLDFELGLSKEELAFGGSLSLVVTLNAPAAQDEALALTVTPTGAILPPEAPVHVKKNESSVRLDLKAAAPGSPEAKPGPVTLEVRIAEVAKRVSVRLVAPAEDDSQAIVVTPNPVPSLTEGAPAVMLTVSSRLTLSGADELTVDIEATPATIQLSTDSLLLSANDPKGLVAVRVPADDNNSPTEGSIVFSAEGLDPVSLPIRALEP